MTSNDEPIKHCPTCQSDDILWSNKKQLFRCEGCNHSWTKPLDTNELSEADYCKDLANSGLWQQSVLNEWPAPIAHEYQQLKNILNDGLFIAAIFQLKDVVEITIKVSAITMYQWLHHTVPYLEELQEVRKELFMKQLSLGSWLQLTRTVAQLILDNEAANKDLGKQLATWLYSPVAARDESSAKPKPKQTAALKLLNDMVNWRNDEIGHGALRLKTEELWDDFTQKLEKLHQVLIDGDPWQNTTLYTINSDDKDLKPKPLIGWDSIIQRHDQLTPMTLSEHQTSSQYVTVSYLDDSKTDSQAITISLSPYIQAHTCKHCSLQDIFIYDSHNRQRFYHLDYLSGHRIKLADHEVPALKREVEQAQLHLVDDEDANLKQPALNQSVVNLLEEKSLESSYQPPTYLRTALSEFIDIHEKGLFWLQSPAHTGKSIFVHSLDYKVNKTPLLDDLIAVKFHIRREFRYFAHHFVESLTGQLKTAFNLTSGTEQLPEIDLSEGKLSLVNWLNRWWQVSRKSDTHRLLIAIDGLDEIGEPERTENGIQTSILDILPSNTEIKHLNDGIYLLLTSRKVTDCPNWMQDKIKERLSNIDGLIITLKHPDYIDLLHQYFKQHLKEQLKLLSAEQKDELFATLIEKAESRFLYFSLLVGLINEQQLNRDQLQQLPAGERLYGHYIQNLEQVLGKDSKQFKRIQDLLTLLTACEQAAVADAKIQDEAKNAFVESDTVLSSSEDTGELYWEGLDLATIAGLLDEPDGIWSSQLIFTLYSLKSLIKVERSSQQAHYRLGLKELSSFINAHWKEEVAQWHYRLSTPFYRTWKDCWNALDTNVPENYYQLRYLIGHALLNENTHIDDNNLSCYKLLLADTELCSIYLEKSLDQFQKTRLIDALFWCNLILYLLHNNLTHELDNDYRNRLGFMLCHRANIYSAQGETTAAMHNYNQSLRLLGSLHEQMRVEGKYKPEYLHNLSESSGNRANLSSQRGNNILALNDYNQAIEIREFLHNQLSAQGIYPPAWQNGLAVLLKKRAILYNSDNALKAMVDYNRAIGLQVNLYNTMMPKSNYLIPSEGKSRFEIMTQGNIEVLYYPLDYGFNADGNYLPQWQNDLGNTLINRANLCVQLDMTTAALDDYSKALKLQQGLATNMDANNNVLPQWQNDYTNTLAIVGNLYCEIGQPSAALEMYDRAIELQESLHKKMSVESNYPPEWQNNLANQLLNRANIRSKQKDIEAALDDYNQAIELQFSLYEQMSEKDNYSHRWQNDLANTLGKRAVFFSDQGDVKAALADYEKANDLFSSDLDYNLAIELKFNMYKFMRTEGNYLPEWQHDLAYTLAKRAFSYNDEGNFTAALDDYNQAIALKNDLYERMSAKGNYLSEWQNNFAYTLGRRAILYSDKGDFTTALDDYDKAVVLWFDLYEKMNVDNKYPPEWQNNLAYTLGRRATLCGYQGDMKAALDSYDQAIMLHFDLCEKMNADSKYPPEWQNTMAIMFANRATIHENLGDFIAALNDYNQSIELQFSLYKLLSIEGNYLSEWQNDLASILNARALFNKHHGNVITSMADFKQAIELQLDLKQLMSANANYPPAWQNELANMIGNQANLYIAEGDMTVALAGYNQAIELQLDLQQQMKNENNYSPAWQNDLANTFYNRADLHNKLDNVAAALDDFDKAFELQNSLYIKMSYDGNYPTEWQNRFGMMLDWRADIHEQQGNIEAALVDFEKAIELKESIYMQMVTISKGNYPSAWKNSLSSVSTKDHYLPEWQNSLANTYYNRALLLTSQKVRMAALDDYNQSIKLQFSLYEKMSAKSNYPHKWQYKLANTFHARANLNKNLGNVVASLSDCNQSVELHLALHRQMISKDNYPVEWQYKLATIFDDRADLYDAQGDITAALADYNHSIELQFALYKQMSIVDDYPVEWQHKLASLLYYRALVYSDERGMTAELADYNLSIELQLSLYGQMIGSSNYLPQWQNDLADTLCFRGRVLLLNDHASEGISDLDKGIEMLYDLAIVRNLQTYLHSLIRSQYLLCRIVINNALINSKAKIFINDIESNYSTKQLSTDEYQLLSELKSFIGYDGLI